MLEEIVGTSLGVLTALYVGYNLMYLPQELGKRFIAKSQEAQDYEKSLKEKRNTFLGFSKYYLGYMGRQFAYKEIKK